MAMNVAIVGAGLIGRKRAAVVANDPGARLALTVDIDMERAQTLARDFGGEAASDWRRAVDARDIDIVIVSTVNKFLAPVSMAAMNEGKHVLCEKPLGRSVAESTEILRAASAKGRVLKTGFNHRYHPAVSAAKELLDAGAIGRVMFLRCRYGHGARPGYEKEWRSDREISGGGELLDQGVHVIDLFRWFAGDFDSVMASTSTAYWEMDVEDNAFVIFRKKTGETATMHTSWTQWRNIFSFEVFGRDGYLVIDGLGGSYGTERLTVGRRAAGGGRPEERTFEYPGADVSWEREWADLVSAIKDGREPSGGALDGFMATYMVEKAYESALGERAVSLMGPNLEGLC
jgi:predicted dehydrogenase